MAYGRERREGTLADKVQDAGTAGTGFDAPGTACGLLKEEEAPGGSRGAGGSGGAQEAPCAPKPPRTLQAQGTRTPPKERTLQAQGTGTGEEGAHHGHTEREGADADEADDGRMSDTESVAAGEDATEAADGPDGTMDFDEYCRQLTARTDAKLEVIKQEHNAAILSLGKKMQQHMKQTQLKMDKLSAQVDESREHTARVRLQVVSAAHQAYTRWAETSKKHESLEAKVDALSALVANMLPTAGGAQAPRAGSSGNPRALPPSSALTSRRRSAATRSKQQ